MTENFTSEDLKKSKPWYKKVSKKIVLFSTSFFILGSASTFLITNTLKPKPDMDHIGMNRPNIGGGNMNRGNNQNSNGDESDTQQSFDIESEDSTAS